MAFGRWIGSSKPARTSQHPFYSIFRRVLTAKPRMAPIMKPASPSETTSDRTAIIHQAFWLECLTLAWMTVEPGVAIASGIAANSLTLVAFGIDSVIELASGGILDLAPYGRTPARADVRRQRRAKSITHQRCFAVRPCHLRCRKRWLEALDTPRRGVLAARSHPMRAGYAY